MDQSHSVIPATYYQLQQIIDNGLTPYQGFNLDAFARQRFSQPQTIFDSKQLADKQPLFWDDQEISGGGTSSTYNTNQSSTTIAVSNLTAGTRVRQTFRWFNYQPGKSQLILMTGTLNAAATGIKRRSGIFNNRNGIFIEQTIDGLFLVIRSYTSGVVVDNKIHQSNAALSTDGVSTWNLDAMNGSGESAITLNHTKSFIWGFDYEWLGVGTVALFFVINRKIYYAHFNHHSNILEGVYMSVPNLPLRYEISNDGTGPAASFRHICSTVISEGGIQDTGFPFGVTRGATALTTNNDTNIYPLIALRLNSSYFTSTIKILDFYINCTSTATYNWYLILNPTVVGTAFSFSAVTNSSLDADVARTNATTLTGGTILLTGVTSQNNEGGLAKILNSDFSLGSTIAGVSDIIVLAIQRITGTTETFYATINWKDQQ